MKLVRQSDILKASCLPKLARVGLEQLGHKLTLSKVVAIVADAFGTVASTRGHEGCGAKEAWPDATVTEA